MEADVAAITQPESPVCNESIPSVRCPARYLWAVLLARIYEVFPLTCLHCGGAFRIIAFITDAVPLRQSLDHIGEPTAPPAIHPVRAPPIEEAE